MNLEVPKPPDDEKKENKKYKRVPVVPIFVVILKICGTLFLFEGVVCWWSNICIIKPISNQKTPEQIRAEEEVKGDFGRW